MAKKRKKSAENNNDRIIDLMERFGAINLYLFTDMDHHSIARRLGMGTQRVTALLKGLKKIK